MNKYIYNIWIIVMITLGFLYFSQYVLLIERPFQLFISAVGLYAIFENIRAYYTNVRLYDH